MSARLFRTCMKHGSVLLFVCFFVSFVAAFGSLLMSYREALAYANTNPVSDNGMALVFIGALARAFAQSAGYAATLLGASALLFRADKWLEAAV
jgi:hypothetical protein